MQFKNNKGMTLIELMIVVVIIALLAAIAIPFFLKAKITANETAAVATLKNLFSYEEICKSSLTIDINGNGTGEYGTLGEISGAYLRSLGSDGGLGTGVAQPFTPGALRPKDPGISDKSGYLYKIYLPSTVGQAVTDASTIQANVAATLEDAFLQESRFRFYAWPGVFNNTGIKCFAVNETGEVLSATNKQNNTFVYSAAQIPPFDAAVATGNGAPAEVDTTFSGLFLSGSTAIDGQIWSVVGN